MQSFRNLQKAVRLIAHRGLCAGSHPINRSIVGNGSVAAAWYCRASSGRYGARRSCRACRSLPARRPGGWCGARRPRPNHVAVDRGALRGRQFRQCWVPEDETCDELHPVEPGPRWRRHRRNSTACNRHLGALQCLPHPALAFHRMRRRQQFARRLLAQDIAAARRIGQATGGFGLAAAAALRRRRQAKAIDSIHSPSQCANSLLSRSAGCTLIPRRTARMRPRACAVPAWRSAHGALRRGHRPGAAGARWHRRWAGRHRCWSRPRHRPGWPSR